MDLLEKIIKCETMPQLDAMRMELVVAGKGNPDMARTLQAAFIRQKNRLKRIPLKDRNW